MVEIYPNRSAILGIQICDKNLKGIKNLKLIINGLYMLESFPMLIKDSITMLVQNRSERKIYLKDGDILGTIKEGLQHSLD